MGDNRNLAIILVGGFVIAVKGDVAISQRPHAHREAPQVKISLLGCPLIDKLERRAETDYLGEHRVFIAVGNIKLYHAVLIGGKFAAGHVDARKAANGKHVEPHRSPRAAHPARSVVAAHLHLDVLPRYLPENFHHFAQGVHHPEQCPAYHFRRYRLRHYCPSDFLRGRP